MHEKDSNGNAAILEASRNVHIPVLFLLLSHGANVHDKNSRGDTAILIASGHCNITIVLILLSHGANAHEISFRREIQNMIASNIIFQWPLAMLLHCLQRANVSLDSDAIELLGETLYISPLTSMHNASL